VTTRPAAEKRDRKDISAESGTAHARADLSLPLPRLRDFAARWWYSRLYRELISLRYLVKADSLPVNGKCVFRESRRGSPKDPFARISRQDATREPFEKYRSLLPRSILPRGSEEESLLDRQRLRSPIRLCRTLSATT